MAPTLDPAPDVDVWQLSNPPIFAMTPLKASLMIYDEVGLPAIRGKSIALTGFMESLLRERLGDRVRIMTPGEPEHRGAQLSLVVGEASRDLRSRLEGAGVVLDSGSRTSCVRRRRRCTCRSMTCVGSWMCWRGSWDDRRLARHVLIAGAGLAGALLARMLGGRGYRVTVCERRPDPRAKGFVGGRSINLALSTRGLTALDRVGLARRVLDDAIPMPGRMMHDEAGRLTFQAYSSDPSDAINSVSRGGLNITLLDAAEACEGVELRFGQRCVDVDLDAPAATFRDETSGDETRIGADVVVGADGAFSRCAGGCRSRTGSATARSTSSTGTRSCRSRRRGTAASIRRRTTDSRWSPTRCTSGLAAGR